MAGREGEASRTCEAFSERAMPTETVAGLRLGLRGGGDAPLDWLYHGWFVHLEFLGDLTGGCSIAQCPFLFFFLGFFIIFHLWFWSCGISVVCT